MEKIKKIEIFCTNIPIHQPYKLSFTTVGSFETCFVCLETSDGRCAWGDTTPLPGYSQESCADAWTHLRRLAPNVLGLPLEDVRPALQAYLVEMPFTCSPFLTALDVLQDEFFWQMRPSEEIRCPIVGILNTDDPDKMTDAFCNLVSLGYRTIKYKIGHDVLHDIECVRLLDALASERNIKYRLDANQGYSINDARFFLDKTPMKCIEYIEQPLARNAWDEMKQLVCDYSVDFLLDESIWVPDDIQTAVRNQACALIKCKLYKHGGLLETKDMLQKARQAGLIRIIGNGVQTDLGCFYEAFLASTVIMSKAAGEMNGFLKQKMNLLETPLRFDKGELCAQLARPSIDRERLDEVTVDQECFI